MVKWFICQNEDVEGPFETQEVKQRLESGQLDESHLIWGPLQNEWKKPSWWQGALPDLLKQVKPTKEEQPWHYVANEVSHGPLKRFELILALKDLENKSDVYVWTNGMPSWVPLFDCVDLVESIGISRRQHPRAEIDGSIVIEIDDQEHIGVLKTVSAGGCGILGIEGLEVGQIIHISMRSAHFYKVLKAKAEVRYTTETGFAGLMFKSINMEEKAAIINYVKSYFNHNEEREAA